MVTVAVTDCSLLQALPSPSRGSYPLPPLRSPMLFHSPPPPAAPRGPFIAPSSPSMRSRRPGAPHTAHDPPPSADFKTAAAAQAKQPAPRTSKAGGTRCQSLLHLESLPGQGGPDSAPLEGRSVRCTSSRTESKYSISGCSPRCQAAGCPRPSWPPSQHPPPYPHPAGSEGKAMSPTALEQNTRSFGNYLVLPQSLVH